MLKWKQRHCRLKGRSRLAGSKRPQFISDVQIHYWVCCECEGVLHGREWLRYRVKKEARGVQDSEHEHKSPCMSYVLPWYGFRTKPFTLYTAQRKVTKTDGYIRYQLLLDGNWLVRLLSLHSPANREMSAFVGHKIWTHFLWNCLKSLPLIIAVRSRMHRHYSYMRYTSGLAALRTFHLVLMQMDIRNYVLWSYASVLSGEEVHIMI